ncbi:MAG: hypothetical protein IM654_01915 [Phenylobacterium sp.]|nr:hypothetical protein [Phenylobacterium sp.]
MIPFPTLSLRAWAALALVALVAFACINAVRVGRLKDDLAKAEKSAAEARSALAWQEARARTCEAALSRQKAAVDALEAAGRVKLAKADKAAADARAVAASARKQADALLTARLNGANACERAEDVRRRFEEAVP